MEFDAATKRRIAQIQAQADDPRPYDNARGDVLFLLRLLMAQSEES